MTILVPIDTIKVAPERVRSAFDLDYIENLADDIAQHGLYHHWW